MTIQLREKMTARSKKALALGLLLIVALIATLLAPKPAHAAKTFTVDNSLDPGDGNCSSNGLGCTLREAINAANSNPGEDLIRFNIANPEVQTIKLTSELPTIIDTVTIDGYTQPGSSPNTLAKGTNAKLLIELDGSNLGPNGDGLEIQHSNSVVKGLVINRFGDDGVVVVPSIFIDANPSARIEGNFIGTDPSGTADRGNSGDGVHIENARRAFVGGGTPEARNLISANGNNGVLATNAAEARALDNLIGTKKDGTTALGNFADGVQVSSGDDNFVGGTTAGSTNTIAFNGSNGVDIVGSDATGNRVLRNSVFSNVGLGIDLNNDGPTANDPKDPDTGANNLQNKPALTSATTSLASTTIKGNLNSTPGKSFTVLFFSGPSGQNEGKSFVGQKSVTTNSNGVAAFTFSPANKVSVGQTVTATTTDSGGNTSEFSAPRKVATL